MPKGTVLFVGIDARMTNYRIATGDPNVNRYWEIAFKFLVRDNGMVGSPINEHAGHNFFWDQGQQRWDLVTTDGTTAGKRLYEYADLNTLFTIG